MHIFPISLSRHFRIIASSVLEAVGGQHGWRS